MIYTLLNENCAASTVMQQSRDHMEIVLPTYILDPQTRAILLPNTAVGHLREQLSAAPSFWNQSEADPLLSTIFQHVVNSYFQS